MKEDFIKSINEYQNIIHKICRLYRNSPEDREDLFQEIVYQLWKSYPKFKGESKISTWIYRVAFNTSIVTFRKNKISISNYKNIPEKFHPTLENSYSENEERIFELLSKLNSIEKSIITLYLEDYNYEEIATIIGISENNVGVKLNRIKNKLKIK
ncbi:RNA polymerase sigma factor [Flavobacterium flavigenum]|uniref:RNA polymerase sigma factor n=1 Tax=Flavobacterium flavigenum TaxID=3003258 RepID=UPI0022AC8977|nr:sigma-70 family RNA polymerase sigma factor [Flavobacterium flavigenum]